MNKTKFVVRVAMCVALLIAAQLALSSVAGIEIVTVMLLCFCYCYGVRHGIATATTFSLLRCFVFGFQINVIVLYLVYYNLFAIFFGWLGAHFAGKNALLKTVVVAASAVVFTAMFTLLDDVLTPLIYGFNENAARVYFYQSLAAMIPQMICTAVSVTLLFHPLTKVIKRFNY